MHPYFLSDISSNAIAGTIEACSIFLECAEDDHEFILAALDICKYQEDRVGMCAMLGIPYIPLGKKPTKEETAKKKRTVSYGLGSSDASNTYA